MYTTFTSTSKLMYLHEHGGGEGGWISASYVLMYRSLHNQVQGMCSSFGLS